jgi:hypothetical protein
MGDVRPSVEGRAGCGKPVVPVLVLEGEVLMPTPMEEADTSALGPGR